MSEVLRKTVQLEQQAMGDLGITDRRLEQARRQERENEAKLRDDQAKLEQHKAKLAQAAQRLREAQVELEQDMTSCFGQVSNMIFANMSIPGTARRKSTNYSSQ